MIIKKQLQEKHWQIAICKICDFSHSKIFGHMANAIPIIRSYVLGVQLYMHKFKTPQRRIHSLVSKNETCVNQDT